MSTIDGFVPTKTFNWYQMSKQSYFVPHKTFSRDKTRTNCRPHPPTHQDNHTGNRHPSTTKMFKHFIREKDNHTGNRHPSTTASLTSATRPCTPIRQTKRQRNGSTDMDTVPRKIGIRRVIPCRFPRLSLMRRPEQIQDYLHRIERIQRNLDKTRVPVTHRTVP